MKSRIPQFPVVSSVVLGLALTSTAQGFWGQGYERDHEEEMPFSEAHLFFELNNTDGDLGIHALIDGDAWEKLKIEDPKEREILNVRVGGRLQRQGLTEIFFESAEPTFEELSPQKVLPSVSRGNLCN